MPPATAAPAGPDRLADPGAPGYEQRLEELYRRLLPVVYGYCRARLAVHEAEDVTAEVFRAAAEQLRREPSSELTPGWFTTAARHRIVDRWRRESRLTAKLPVLAATIRHQRPRPPDDAFDDRSGVLSALDRLPPLHRAVLVLHHVEGRPISEIASTLDRGPRAVESLLARARRGLLSAMDPDGGSMSSRKEGP